MSSQEFQNFLKNFPACMMDADDSLDVVRAKMDAIHPKDHADDTLVERTEIAGVPCAWISVPESDAQRIVFFVHGGAFVSTGITEYMRTCETVARVCRARVMLVEYSLAPERRFPTQLEELLSVYDTLQVSPSRIAFMGDSCGGGMALALTCQLRDRGDPVPACYAGLTPWFDAHQNGDAAVNPRGVDPFLNRGWIQARFKDYAGNASLDNPLLSPIRSKLAGLPPLYLGVGTVDTTSDDSTQLAASAAKSGVQVLLDINADMVHGLHGLSGVCPEADQAMARVGQFVQSWIPADAS